LISAQIAVSDGSLAIERISFLFGFTTDETQTPGEFLDSLTAALSDETSITFMPIVTVDAATVLWAPGGDGTVPVSDSDLVREEIAYPLDAPMLATRRSWRVEFLVPDNFHGAPLFLYFDLFNNGNSMGSAAWFDDVVAIPVPEPAGASLILIGVCCRAIFKRRDPG